MVKIGDDVNGFTIKATAVVDFSDGGSHVIILGVREYTAQGNSLAEWVTAAMLPDDGETSWAIGHYHGPSRTARQEARGDFLDRAGWGTPDDDTGTVQLHGANRGTIIREARG